VIDGLVLNPLLMNPIGTLSKGQRKRVLLAIGLLTSQPMLLADEPFEGLDLRQTREVAAILRDHARSGRTLFLSIHQISDAARICDRFVLLSSGKMCGAGTLDELSALARAKGAAASTLEEVFLALT
jgi:ABC-2 type transport system ATP-binding protein